jgi:prepilin-type N-terminal cleavage/methylation domain-containing protein
MNNILKKQNGFTLAEVLITLLIIGVVASLVIPALINDTQEAEFHVAWKKIYSELDQATRRIVQDNAGTLKGLCAADPHNCIKNLYSPYLNTSKICDSGTLNGNCWYDSFYYYDKTLVSTFANRSGFVLSSGILVRLEANGFPACTNNSWVSNVPKCAFINVDINGFKGPNTVGKDIYFMILTENKLIPLGINDNHINNCVAGDTGWGCAAKFLYQ